MERVKVTRRPRIHDELNLLERALYQLGHGVAHIDIFKIDLLCHH